MAVFIEVTTDAFRDTFAATTAGKRNANGQRSANGRAGAASVRRPLRGIEIKEDTYAIIRVIQSNGKEIPLLDSGSPGGQTTGYSNFILQQVSEARMEKHQIVETFGDAYIFFFGESPRFLDVVSLLINTNDFNWEAEWWANYDNNFRGTKSVENGARTYLFYDDTIVEGYMLQAQAAKVAEQPNMLQLTFRLFLTNYSNVTAVGDTNFPIRSIVNLPSGVSLTDALNGEQIDSLVQQGTGFSANRNIVRELPIRSAISDNRDEWTSDLAATGTTSDGDSGTSDVDDLHQSAMDMLSDHGVGEGGADLMGEMGLGVKFKVGVSIGFSAKASASASFGASAGASFGFSAKSTFGVKASASLSFGASVGAGASYGGGVGAGASTYVGGRPSAFALTSAEGTLDRTGQARASASASVGFSAKASAGFSF